MSADPGGRAFEGVGLRSLDYWDRGIRPRSEHGCSSLEFVMSFVA
jgi:hypothetical protein